MRHVEQSLGLKVKDWRLPNAPSEHKGTVLYHCILLYDVMNILVCGDIAAQ